MKSNPELRTACEHGSGDARFLSMHGIDGIVRGTNGDLSHHSEKGRMDFESVKFLYQKPDSFVTKSSKVN